jgi:hypothetical protein
MKVYHQILSEETEKLQLMPMKLLFLENAPRLQNAPGRNAISAAASFPSQLTNIFIGKREKFFRKKGSVSNAPITNKTQKVRRGGLRVAHTMPFCHENDARGVNHFYERMRSLSILLSSTVPIRLPRL